MRVFLAIAGVLLLLSFGSQAIRHGFWRWVAARPSVLEPYAEETQQQIAESKSIEALVAMYAQAHKKVKEIESQDRDREESEYERREREPYKSEQLLRDAIETWELHQRQIYEVQFLWWGGAIACLAGALVLHRIQWWLGISLLLLGFVEMSYATCPPFSLGGSSDEFLRLLTYKLCYSVAAVVMLLVAWWYVSQQLNSRFPPKSSHP